MKTRYKAKMIINFLDDIYTVIIYKDSVQTHKYTFRKLGSAHKFLLCFVNGER